MQEISIGGSLTDQAYVSLRSAIVAGELKPDELYSVFHLANLLNVSKTPVREALIKLSTEKMVRFERNRGVRVLRTTAHDIEEVFQLRILLEVPAAADAAQRMTSAARQALVAAHADMIAVPSDQRRAAQRDEFMRRDRRFHELVLAATGNERLTAFVANLRDMVLTRGLCTAGESRSYADIAGEHQLILEAIQTRDAAGAAAAMREHLQHTARLLIRQEFGPTAGPEGLDADPEEWAGPLMPIIRTA